MTPELLGSIAGIVLSLVFSYVPKVKDSFGALSGDYKRLVMLGMLLLTAVGIFGLSCLNWYNLVACDVTGIKDLVEIFILSAVANQGAYMLTPKGE